MIDSPKEGVLCAVVCCAAESIGPDAAQTDAAAARFLAKDRRLSMWVRA
jgi:hypothetical protein